MIKINNYQWFWWCGQCVVIDWCTSMVPVGCRIRSIFVWCLIIEYAFHGNWVIPKQSGDIHGSFKLGS